MEVEGVCSNTTAAQRGASSVGLLADDKVRVSFKRLDLYYLIALGFAASTGV